MNETPKALRLHIGIFGRTNTGKSSFVNLITGQSISIVSPVAGTTTDVVRKSMELLPVGPVTFLDTAGINDDSGLGELRIGRTKEALTSSDIAVLVLEPGVWTDYEAALAAEAEKQNTPLILVINKSDMTPPENAAELPETLPADRIMRISCATAEQNPAEREAIIQEFKRLVLTLCPDDFLEPPAILGDLLPAGKDTPHVVLIVPIDTQAPKGRIILPQVQAIRDTLDFNAASTVVKENGYPVFLTKLAEKPDLVVCDSQVARKMVVDTPDDIACTTFSILFSRYKGEFPHGGGGAAIHRLKEGDRVLISEACTHHPLLDDIGRIKIPKWLRIYRLDIACVHTAGKEYPTDLTIRAHHPLRRLYTYPAGNPLADRTGPCGGYPVTNYGIAISVLQGVAERTLSPFPEALAAYHAVKDRRTAKGAPE